MSARPIPSTDDGPPRGGWLIACLTVLLAGGTAASAACQVPSDVDRYRAVRELSVGEMDGPLALTRVEHIVVHGPRVFVSQPSEQRIRVLSAESGELLDEWGGRGSGPGEFQDLAWIGILGDAVMALDTRLRRVTTFEPEGPVREVERYDLPPPSPPFLFGGWVLPTLDGNLLVFRDVLAREEATPETLLWLLTTPAGAVLDTLPPFRQRDRSIVLRREGGISAFSRPIHRGDRFAMAPDGSRFVQASDEGPGLSLSVYHTAERRAETVELGVPRVDVPRAVMDSLQAGLRAALAGRPLTAGVDRRELEGALALPEWVPAVDEMSVTADGETWLREPNFIGSASDLWRVVDPEGAVRATVEVPSGVVLRARDGNHVWGYRIDQEVRFYTVERLRLEPIG